MGEHEYGIDPATVDLLAREIVSVQTDGLELAIVVGGKHLPWHGRGGRRDGSRNRGLRGHARHGVERSRAPGRARAARRRHARAVRARGFGGRGALYSASRDAPPREGADRDLRGRHGEPVLHDGHRSSPAGARDRRRGDPDGQERYEGCLRRRPAHGPRRDVPAHPDPPRGDRARAQGDGHDRALALHGERAADPRLRTGRGEHPPSRTRPARGHDHLRLHAMPDNKES